MRCEKCNVNLYGDVDICPLCHNKILQEPLNVSCHSEQSEKSLGIQENTHAAQQPFPCYPPKSTKKRIHKHFTPNSIYLFAAALIFLICVTVNYLTNSSFLWCYLVGACLVYGYIILAHTVQSHSGVGVKLFIQGCSIALLSWLCEVIIGKKNLIFNFTLPIILSTLILILVGFLIFTAKHNRSLFISSIMISLLGYIPIILFACKVATVFLPSLITAILASVTLVGTIAFGIFDLKEQFSKVFHI